MASLRAALLAALVGLGAGGCVVGDPSAIEATTPLDESAILSSLQEYREARSSFVRLNQAAYHTALQSGALINVYVSSRGFAPYATIAPEQEGSGATLPPRTLIVRELVDDTGSVESLTLMYKGPAGYNPDLGDYWFGVTDAAGVPLTDARGQRRVGRMTECYGCHIPRADDDYLFGVPAINRQHPVR